MVNVRWASPAAPILNLATTASVDATDLNIVHKFGRNTAVGTTVEPVSISGLYRTPSTITALEIVSSSSLDADSKVGAREVYVQGIGTGWTQADTAVTLNGTTPVAIGSFFRIYRAYVTKSGTYATQSSASQKGTITIQENGGGDAWVNIDTIQSGFGAGQTQIASYTIPINRIAYIKTIGISVDSGKTATVYLFKRDRANVVTAPYSALRIVDHYDGVQGVYQQEYDAPLGPFVGPCDIGFMAKVESTVASVSVDYEIFEYGTQGVV